MEHPENAAEDEDSVWMAALAAARARAEAEPAPSPPTTTPPPDVAAPVAQTAALGDAAGELPDDLEPEVPAAAMMTFQFPLPTDESEIDAWLQAADTTSRRANPLDEGARGEAAQAGGTPI